MDKKQIKDITLSELENFLKEQNQPSFRKWQILEWLYKFHVDNFSQMTNLPKLLIQQLSKTFVITKPNQSYLRQSKDKTKKYILEFKNIYNPAKNTYVECVGLPSLNNNSNKLTACISTQAGCPMKCSFCATGKQGFQRNLSVGEIVEQVIFIQESFKLKVSNIVIMGQGEPFLNYSNLIDALEILNNKHGLCIGSRKITVSTCGIIPKINNFANIDKQFELAVSLHSAIQTKRDKIMPGVKNFTLRELKSTLINFQKKTNRRITFEYLMINNLNDSNSDLKALIDYCKDIHCFINIIKLNKTSDYKFTASNNNKINEWIHELSKFGIKAALRQSRGSDIEAACGQLINNLNK